MNQPDVSVIIPVRNEEHYIRGCLDAVFAQDFPAHAFEVLVVDGCSTDTTRDIIAGYQRTHPNLRLLENPKRKIPYALNIGIAAARGDFIVRVDGHTIIETGYLTACVKTLKGTGAANVGGSRVSTGRGFWGKVIAVATSDPFARPGKYYHATTLQEVDTVFLGAFPRATFHKVGMYDETILINEDYELNYRIRKSGGKIMFSPEIHSTYYGRETLGALWRQYWHYGLGKGSVIKRHPHSTSIRHWVAPAFVAALAAGLGLALFGVFWPLVAVLAPYLALSTFFAVKYGGTNGPSFVLALILTHFAIHLAWGAGLLTELLTPVPAKKAALGRDALGPAALGD